MKAEILKIAGVKNEKEFYEKFPTKEAFMKMHGKEFKKAKLGKTTQDKGQLKKLNQLTDFGNPPVAQTGILSPAYGATSGVNPALMYGQPTYSGITGLDLTPAENKMDISAQTGYIEGAKPISGMTGGSSLFDKLGGAAGMAQAAGSIVGGITAISAEGDLYNQAKQQERVTDVMANAAISSRNAIPIKRKYVRPEDAMFNPEQLYPSYGVGSNILSAKKGGKIKGNPTEIQNKYVPPTDVYSDLGYVPKAAFGIADFAKSGGIDIAGSLGSALAGGPSGQSQIAGTLGKVAGSILGGPVGGAIGNFFGSALGGTFSKQKEIDKLREKTQRNIASISGQNIPQQFNAHMRDGGQVSNYEWVSHTWQPQKIVKFGEHNLKSLLKPDPTMDTLRTGGNIRQNEMFPQNQFALGGELQTTWGGYAEPISHNPYLPGSGETVMFKGNSHEESDRKGRTGIGVKYGNDGEYSPYMEYGKDGVENVTDVEVERGEPAVELPEINSTSDTNLQSGGEVLSSKPSLNVYGNLVINNDMAKFIGDPRAKGMKYKNYVSKILTPEENKQNSLLSKSADIANRADDNTPIGKIGMSTAAAIEKGANMKLKKIADQKIKAAISQNETNSFAEEFGIDADALAKGKMKIDKEAMKEQAKWGKSIEKAQSGEVVVNPNNPIYVKIPGGSSDIPVFYDQGSQRWRYLKPRPGSPSRDGYGEYVPETFNQSFTNQYYNQRKSSTKETREQTPTSSERTRPIAPTKRSTKAVASPSSDNLQYYDDNIEYVGRDAEGFPIVSADISSPKGDSRKLFKDVGAIADYYKQFGYTGGKNIGELQRWIKDQAEQNPRVKQELTTYLRRSDIPLTNLGKRKYKGKSKSQLSDDELVDQFVDNLWEYRFPKIESMTTPTREPLEHEQKSIPTTSQTTTLVPAAKVPPTSAKKRNTLVDVFNQVLPYLRPSDAEPLDPRQLYGELFAMSDQVEPVQAQLYRPQLKSIYDISLQDQLNEVTAQARAAERMAANNPAAAANIMSMANRERSKILGEQTRMNQALQAGIIGENINTLNDAQLKNLAIRDTQYGRQEQAESMTEATKLAALQSMGDKYLQNQLANRTLQTYENLYNYRYDPAFRAMNMNPLFQATIPQVGDTAGTSDKTKGLAPGYGFTYDESGQIIGTRKLKKDEDARNGSIVKALKRI